MDRYACERPGEVQPDPPNEEQKIIQDKGIEHERAFLNVLTASGKRVCDLSEFRGLPEPTLDAMRRGEEIIYQGYLMDGEFAGYPDFLVRVESPSVFGSWSYEPWDTKLARRPIASSQLNANAVPPINCGMESAQNRSRPLSIWRTASNLVLLGDQMQLDQPIQGSHPGESGLSALDYLLQGQSNGGAGFRHISFPHVAPSPLPVPLYL